MEPPDRLHDVTEGQGAQGDARRGDAQPESDRRAVVMMILRGAAGKPGRKKQLAEFRVLEEIEV